MAFIPEHLVEEVRQASEIVDVVSEYVTLKKRGQNYFGLCPFHAEKTGSFSVHPDKQIFHCFGCGAGGNVFTFIMKETGVSFPEAVRILARRAGIAIPEPDELDGGSQEREALFYACEMAADFFVQRLWSPEGEKARAYLEQREFREKDIRDFGLGYAPAEWSALHDYALSKGMKADVLQKAGLLNKRDSGGFYDRFRDRLMFPIYNLSGKVIAFGGRKLDGDDSVPKYVNSPETDIYHKSNVLYGLFQARDHIRDAKVAVFVEGYTDVMRLVSEGFRNTVATSGTALTELQARLIRRYTDRVVMLYDSDTAGAAATMRGADVLVEQGVDVRVGELEEGEDPDSFLRKYGSDALQQRLAYALPLLDYKTRSLPHLRGKEAYAEKLHSLIATLSRIQDGVERQEKIHFYAEKMKIDEEMLWDEVRRLRKLQRSRRSGEQRRRDAGATSIMLPAGKSSYAEKSRVVEEELVRIMIQNHETVAFIRSFMQVTDFYHDSYRMIASLLYELDENNVRLEPEDLIHYFPDQEAGEFVSKVVLHEPRFEGIAQDDYRRAADCLAKLQRLMLETRIDELREQIRDREKSGGDSSELATELYELTMQRKQIKAENFIVE